MKNAMSIKLEPSVRDEFYYLCKKAGVSPANVITAAVAKIVHDKKIVIDVDMTESDMTVARGLAALDRIQAKAPEVPPTLDEVNAIITEARAAANTRNNYRYGTANG